MLRKIVLDVSNNRTIGEGAVNASKAAALICKATEGTNFKDLTYEAHRAIAKKLKIPFGAYLFIHPDSKGSEAEFFLAYAKPKKGDIQPIIDAETFSGVFRHTTGTEALALRVEACAKALEHKGYKPILYCGPYTWPQMVKYAPYLKKLLVWEAQYPGRFSRWTSSIARLRMAIKGAKVVMWQFTDCYSAGTSSYDASILLTELKNLIH